MSFFLMVPVVAVCFISTLAFFVAKAEAATGINKQINFQGKLVDNNGLNVADSTYTVVFSLYNVSSGGSAAWTESDSVTTSNGVFQVPLGAVTAFPGNIDFNSDTLYLGIKVGSDLEMTPRIRFSAVPYAFNAAALDGVVATNSATQFTLTGGTNGLIDLTVNGSLTLGSTIKPTANGALTVQSTGSNGLTLDTGGAAALAIGATANSITFGATNNPSYSFNGTGAFTVAGGGNNNITFGSNNGTGTVVVQPNAGGQASLIIKNQGSGDLLTASAGATPKFTVAANGNISATGSLTGLAGLTVASGGETITAGGLTVTAGDVAITGGNLTLGGTTRISNTGVGTFAGTTGISSASNAYLQIDDTATAFYRLQAHFNTNGDFALADTSGNSKIYLAGNQQNASLIPIDAVGIGPGITSPHAVLDVEGGSKAGNAVLILNQLGTDANSDLLSASASGATKFTINKSGTVSIAASQSYTGAGAVTLSSGGSSGLNLDSASGRVSVATGDFLNSGLAGVSGAISGDIWYDTTAQKFKINENGTTKTLCNLTDTGCGTGGAVTLQAAYNGGQIIDLSTTGTGLTIGTNAGTQNIVFAPNAGGQAALIINDQGTGDIFTASASGTTKLVLSHAGNLGVGSSSPQEELTLGASANLVGEMALPTGATATVQTGGTLANATYFYVVTASDGVGETAKSTETAGCTSTNAGGGQHTCLLAWNAVVGAASYKIYRTTTSGTYGATTFLTSVTVPTYTDTGAVTLTAGVPPTVTTAYVTKFTFSGNSWLIGDNFGLGTTSPLANLHVKGGKSGGNAAAIFDQVGVTTNDILTGSASGATKFTVANAGNVKLAGGQTSDLDTLAAATLTIGGSTQNGLTLGRSGAATTINGSGLTINPSITATNGISIGSAQSYTGSGAVTLSSGAGTTLTIDSGTTGAINIGTGANGKTITIGNTTANTAITLTTGGTGSITLGSNTGVGNVLVQPNAGGQAALIIKNQGSGDLLTASAGATTKFAISSSGLVSLVGGLTSDVDTFTATTLKIGTSVQNGLTLGRTGATTNINGSSLVLGAATSISGTGTITSNSATALTVGANGSTNPVFTVNASTGSVVTGLQVLGAATGGTTALTVTDSGTAANLSIDAKGTGTITIGGTSTGNITIGNTSTATITLGGSGANGGLTFSTTTGPSYTGSARPQKQIVLSAEYPGAILTASASAAISGNVTSDASPSATMGSATGATPNTFSYENYYQWLSTTTSDQQYTIGVRVTLPKDFSAWVTGTNPYAFTIDFNTAFTTSSLNHLDVYIYQYGDTSSKPVAFRTNQVSATGKNWTQVQIPSTDLTGGAATWDSTHRSVMIFLTMHSANTVNYVQVGDITLNYLAAF